MKPATSFSKEEKLLVQTNLKLNGNLIETTDKECTLEGFFKTDKGRFAIVTNIDGEKEVYIVKKSKKKDNTDVFSIIPVNIIDSFNLDNESITTNLNNL